jgi:acetaldehyde dehydrogenase
VPGYRLEGAVLLEPTGLGAPLRMAGVDAASTGLKVTIHLEVQGAAHYLPAYAGNLDIMTSAALGTAEALIEHATQGVAA